MNARIENGIIVEDTITTTDAAVSAFRDRAAALLSAEADDERASGNYFSAEALDRARRLIEGLPALPSSSPETRAAASARADALAEAITATGCPSSPATQA